MSLGLLLPAGLVALAALLLPLLIHLSRQSEQRRTEFAALRWLSAQLRPRQKLRFEEIFLLLLRLLLLAAFALLLARPVLFGGEGDAPRVLVAPGVDVSAARATVNLPDAKWHWLAPGFPDIETATPPGQQPTASLLREFDASLPAKTPVTVFVPERLDGVDAMRPRLARKVDWRVLPSPVPAAAIARREPAPMLVVRHAQPREPQLPYLRAVASAWRADDAPVTATPAEAADAPVPSTPAASDIASTAQPLPVNARWLAWLAPGELPPPIRDWIARGGIALLDEKTELPEATNAVALWRDDEGKVLVRGVAIGRGRALLLTRPLAPAAWPGLLDGQFPTRLRALFEDAPAPPSLVAAAGFTPVAGGPAFPETPRPLQAWLAALVALLFALERWFASALRRRQAP